MIYVKRFVYADNAATTKISDNVLGAMLPYLREQYGNPSSIYTFGQVARSAVENARETVAGVLGARTDEIFFTSGGTESDNWAIKGYASQMAKREKRHIISTKFEHHAVLYPLKELEKHGYSVTYVDVNENGVVKVEDIKSAIRGDTGLVTVMHANNEIGTVQPISEIGGLLKGSGIAFHTDAVQTAGHIDINVKELNIDMLSLSGHKLHGSKGVGVLYRKKGLKLSNLLDGGAQESNRRAGTENVAAIVGLAQALKEAAGGMNGREARIEAMRDRLIDGVLEIERSRLNGDRNSRLSGNASFCFEGIEGESLLLSLDLEGICASSGSACTSGSLDPSHVLLAIGLPHEIAHGSLRISLSEYNTDEDIDYILEKLPPIVERLRAMSPLWERIKKGL